MRIRGRSDRDTTIHEEGSKSTNYDKIQLLGCFGVELERVAVLSRTRDVVGLAQVLFGIRRRHARIDSVFQLVYRHTKARGSRILDKPWISCARFAVTLLVLPSLCSRRTGCTVHGTD